MRRLVVIVLVVLGVGTTIARKAVHLPADPRDIPVEAQLSATRTQVDLDGDGQREQLILVNALTGRADPRQATEVILAIARLDEGGQRGQLLWVRRVAQETDAPAHSADLMAVDLDGDGGSEILLTWDRSLRASARERWGEVYAVDELARPRRVWEGVWEINTSRDPETPAAERRWFQREVDFGATRRLAGRAILFRNKQRVIAGQPLKEAKITAERVDVRLRSYGP